MSHAQSHREVDNRALLVVSVMLATLMQALKVRRDQGLIDIVNFSDWYDGLAGTRPNVSRVAA